jgi:molybdopterin molybdotransferase
MISLEDARARILAAVNPLPSEKLNSAQALGRFAAEDIFARVDVPGFDNSAMDGYAVRAEDTSSASEGNPARLSKIAVVPAGEASSETVAPGTCVRIFTGSPMPPGADAVVMQEDTRDVDGIVQILCPARPLENVRLRGEDIRSGTVLLKRGAHLTAVHAGILAAAGVSEISAAKQPVVAILATGKELREPGQPLAPGQIYESNRTMLASVATELGCHPVILPIVPDDFEATCSAFQTAFTSGDLIISTGGVSVGDFDFVKDAFTRLNGKIDLWRVAMRPGKPFVFGQLNRKPFFGLPGNPVSALVTFLLLVRPALRKMQGAGEVNLPLIDGELEEPLSNRGDRPHFVRVRWANGTVRAAGPQASHRLGNLGECNGLLELPAQAALAEGTRVKIALWRGLAD